MRLPSKLYKVRSFDTYKSKWIKGELVIQIPAKSQNFPCLIWNWHLHVGFNKLVFILFANAERLQSFFVYPLNLEWIAVVVCSRLFACSLPRVRSDYATEEGKTVRGLVASWLEADTLAMTKIRGRNNSRLGWPAKFTIVTVRNWITFRITLESSERPIVRRSSARGQLTRFKLKSPSAKRADAVVRNSRTNRRSAAIANEILICAHVWPN